MTARTPERLAARATEALSITIVVPWNPPFALSPNSRTSTRTRRHHLAESRDVAIVMGRIAKQDQPWPDRYAGPVTATVHFYWAKGRQRQDIDNLAAQCKGLLDSLEYADIIANDRQIQSLSVRQDRDADGKGFVILTITAVEGAP